MKLILAAVITSTHGVKGQFKVKVLLSEPKNIFEHKIYDAEGNTLMVRKIGGNEPFPICSMESIDSIESAKGKVGLRLYLNRLELPEGKFYKSDLIGLCVFDKKGKKVGFIESVENFGAGEIVIIKADDGRRSSYPLSKQFFAHVGEEVIVEDITHM
jgi:16S rRNA processing protein RimM